MIKIFISNFYILGILTYLGHSILSFRCHNKNNNIVVFISYLIIINLINYNGPSKVRMLILIFIHCLYFFTMFKGRIIHYLLVILPFPLIIIVSEFFTANILNLLTGINTNGNMDSFIYLFALILSNSIITLILYSYVKLTKLFIKKTLPKFTWIIFILPISTLLFILNLNDHRFYLIKEDKTLFLSIIGLMISNFTIIYIFYKVIVSYEYKKELENMRNKEQILIMRTNLMKEHYDSNLMFLHDLLHKCKVFNDDLKSKNFENLRIELDELYSITFKEFNLLYTNSTIINSLISERLAIINKNKIDIKTVIEFNNFTFLSLYEQEKIFATLLDTAISMNLDDESYNRNIILKTSKKNKQVILNLIFSCDFLDCSTIIQHELNPILSHYRTSYSEYYNQENSTINIILVFFLN